MLGTMFVTEVSFARHLRVIHSTLQGGTQPPPMGVGKPGEMTTSLITINVVLAALVVLGIVRLLVHGIVSDRSAHAPVGDARRFEADERKELAA
jgi:hypothetical protein